VAHCRAVCGDGCDDSWSGYTGLVRDDVMAFIASQEFWGIDGYPKAQRCRCKFHSDLLGLNVWVSTSWNREDEGLGSERYEVRATATSEWCRKDHGGATDDRTITKAQWDNANQSVTWDFFPSL
jgi:hypothetical protein